jgi:hypothetical protein
MTHAITEEAFRGSTEILRATVCSRVLALFYVSLQSFDFACYLRATCVLGTRLDLRATSLSKGLSRR